MTPGWKRVALVAVVGGSWLAAIEAVQRPRCSMGPQRVTLRFPEQGIVWLDGEELSGPCDEVSPDRWIRRPWKETDLLIHPDGPEGSGLYLSGHDRHRA